MHDVAAEQRVEPPAIDPFSGDRPWRGKLLAERCLAFFR
jgi:hypothetical protein